MASPPLSDMRILDLTHGVAGPYASMLLGDLGADVIKVEKPGRGDPTRYMNVSDRFATDVPFVGGDYFLAINRNKRSVTIDLKAPGGGELARRLAANSDAVLQSFRPGVVDRLGLSYNDVRALNDTIVYGSLSAYGERGPLAGHPGMDVAVQARSGVMSITGSPGETQPVKPGVSLADFAGGAHLAVGVLGALIHRLRTGVGQEVRVSLLDATMSMLSNYSVAVLDGGAQLGPMGSGHPQLVPFQAFPTRDGHVVIATGTNKLFHELCQVLDLDDLARDPRLTSNEGRVKHRKEVVGRIAERTSGRTTAELVSVLERSQIPCSPVNTMQQAFDDAQLRANDMVVAIEHPVVGSLHALGIPYQYGGSPCAINRPPPTLGQHTEEVLSTILELNEGTISSLRQRGVV